MDVITLENLVFRPCYYGFKFGKHSRLVELQKGHLYLKNLDFFIKEETRTGIKGVGDNEEALLFSSSDVKAFDPNTHTLLFTGKAEVRNSGDIFKPVFCMTAKDIFQNPQSLDFPNLVTSIEFDTKLIEDFSNNAEKLYVLIITDIAEFIRRIELTLIPMNIILNYGLVKYRDTKVIWKTDNGIELNNAFCKNESYKHQEEFRILIETTVDDHFEININDISDISSVVEAENIIKHGLTIDINITEIIELNEKDQ